MGKSGAMYEDSMIMYRDFAYIYDEMMQDVDYIKWADYIEKVFARYKVHPKKIADLACGTGNITLLLAQRGYDIIGMDSSEDMLSVAQDKARGQGLTIPFISQDIRSIALHQPVEAALIMCDGVNYILEDGDLDKVFLGIYSILKPGGILIFDISTHYKLSSVLGNNTIVDNSEDIALIWENDYDEHKAICNMDLTFFVRENSLYRRFDELHVQKAHKVDNILGKLERSNFSNISYYDDLTFNPFKEGSQRVFFVGQKV